MRAIVQRVSMAKLIIDSLLRASIKKGLLAYVCFSPHDSLKEGLWLAKKLLSLRIFNDEQGRFARNLQDCCGSLLIIPNFTLYAEVKNGTRPSFSSGISFDNAKELFETFITQCQNQCTVQCSVYAGIFGTSMQIESIADGPANLIIDIPPQT